jgi:hypothetical protein
LVIVTASAELVRVESLTEEGKGSSAEDCSIMKSFIETAKEIIFFDSFLVVFFFHFPTQKNAFLDTIFFFRFLFCSISRFAFIRKILHHRTTELVNFFGFSSEELFPFSFLRENKTEG